MEVKFRSITVPSGRKAVEALGILFQFLSESNGLLTREKTPQNLGYFLRVRLDSRERRVLFSLLNQLQEETGRILDSLKGESRPTVEHNAACFNKAQQLLTLLDDFVSSHRDSSVDDLKSLLEGSRGEKIRLSISSLDEERNS